MARRNTHEAHLPRRLALRASQAGRIAMGGLLAFALLVQLVFAGAVAERMAFAGWGGDVICAQSADGTTHGSDQQGGPEHPAKCVVCALAALAPPLPPPGGVVPPVPVTHAAAAALAAETPGLAQSRRSPRSSQGPPRSA